MVDCGLWSVDAAGRNNRPFGLKAMSWSDWLRAGEKEPVRFSPLGPSLFLFVVPLSPPVPSPSPLRS